MLHMPVFSRISSSVSMTCRPMFSSLQRQQRWNWVSFLARRCWKVHVSLAWSRAENYCSKDSIGLVGRLLPHLYHTERRSIDLKCGFGYPCISLVINVDIAGGSATQVHELFYCGGSLVVPCDSGLLVGFAGCRLVQHLSFSVFGAGV